jgi:pimeloyl-ACP methyl ester carboxylesterase
VSTESLLVRAHDGRDLEVLLQGAQEGPLLVFHHGSPGAAVPLPALDRAAGERGIRVVLYSRPGFGSSSRNEGRSVADCSADVAAIADHLGADEFFTAGWSGGGPHALACAALLADRVHAAATIAGVAPYDAEGLEWTAGMGEDNQIEYPTAARDPEALLEFMRPHVEALSNAEPDDILRDLRSLISGVDEDAIDGALGEYLVSLFHAAFRSGTWGWYDDDLAFVRSWGFDLAEIDVPVYIWQGREDLMVPFAHGEWLAKHIPSARPRLRPEHGHLSLAVGAIGQILDDLIGEAVLPA